MSRSQLPRWPIDPRAPEGRRQSSCDRSAGRRKPADKRSRKMKVVEPSEGSNAEVTGVKAGRRRAHMDFAAELPHVRVRTPHVRYPPHWCLSHKRGRFNGSTDLRAAPRGPGGTAHTAGLSDLQQPSSMTMPSRASTGGGPSLRRARAREPPATRGRRPSVRLVVEEHEAARVDRAAEGDGIVDARVPPADLRGVLLFEVLRVVQEEVGAVGERAARDPVERPPSMPASAGS